MLPSAGLLLLLVILPLLTLIWFSLQTRFSPDATLTLKHYLDIFRKPLYGRLYWKSIVMALEVTALTTLLAWPAAWALSRAVTRYKALLLSLVIVPFLTSYLLLTYAMMVLLAEGGPLMSLLGWLHLADPASSILYTPRATVLMLTYENIPVMLLVLYSAAEKIDNNWLEAARSLGAPRWEVFRRIIFPLSVPSLLAGLTLVFIPVAGSFVEAQILGGPSGLLIGNVINDQLTRVNNGPLGAALSLVLLVAILLVVGAGHLAARLSRGRAAAGEAGR